MALVSSNKANGQLVSITLSVEGPEEYKAYHAWVRGNMPTCPHCGKPLDPADDKLHVVISSPLVSFFGMNMGRICTACEECGQHVDGTTELDMAAFPSVTNYLEKLRARFEQRRGPNG